MVLRHGSLKRMWCMMDQTRRERVHWRRENNHDADDGRRAGHAELLVEGVVGVRQRRVAVSRERFGERRTSRAKSIGSVTHTKVSSGSQLLQWTYSKNSSKSNGWIASWVDQVIFILSGVPTAPIIEFSPRTKGEAQSPAA